MSGRFGMESFGDCVDTEYFEGFRRTCRGGEPRPVGVVTGDALENSASSALDNTFLKGGREDVASLGGDGSRSLPEVSDDSDTSVALGHSSHIIIVESRPVLISMVRSAVSSSATSVTADV